MQYYIIKQNNFSYDTLDIKDTLEEANKKVDKIIRKDFANEGRLKVIGVPEIKSGLMLFKNQLYYKTIVKEDKSIWYLNNTLMPMNEYDVARKSSKKNKDTILDWILSGKLDEGNEQYDENYINNVYDGKNDGVEEMLDELTNNKTDNESEE